MKNILIIGAGASGLAASVAALRSGHHVTVLEKKEQPGKKLSVTGNGRCNFTNARMTLECYHGHDPAFIEKVLARFSAKDMIDFTRSLGMLETERNGYYYPANLKAQTLIKALTSEIKVLGGEIRTGVNVTVLKKRADGLFEVKSTEGKFTGDAVILACGSEASVKDKNVFSAYDMLKKAGHHLYPVKPVLVPLYGNEGFEKYWDGIRMTGALNFNNESEKGELQLTKEGISGIPAFQLSHGIQEALSVEKSAAVAIDFLPEYEKADLLSMLYKSGKPDSRSEKSLEDLLTLWIPKELVPIILKRAGIQGKTVISALTPETDTKLIDSLKRFSYPVTGAGELSRAQAVSGGTDTREIKDTMESRLLPGLYVTGELLDADGICGGYNLHFAFATGLIAGGSL